ncbi:MAG: NADH-quinone oxidoreductase subunit N [Phycisphaerae bacterium]|jgi:NADH-quinone oxidoreductase subunit N
MGVDALIHLGPELILLVGACATLIAGVSGKAQRAQLAPPVALIAVLLALWVAWRQGSPGSSVVIPGLWLTSLTLYARLIALFVGLLIVLVNWHQPAVEEGGEYMAMILFSLLGVLLTASANDLIVLFFAIELVSIPTYVLIAISREDGRASEAAVKYFFLGAMSAAVLAYGLSFLYGAAGTTTLHTLTDGGLISNFAFGEDLGSRALIGLLLVFVGLAFKVAAVPLHVYAADVYEGAASPVTGLLGFVPKFAGFIALVKVFGACHWVLPPAAYWLVWVVAAATMTIGNVLALLQTNVKRVLAYSSIAHTGYMLIALLVGPVAGSGPMRDGVAALFFYVAVYGVMNLGAFAVLASFKAGGRSVETLDELSGLARRAPASAFALAVCVFSLMGMPLLGGFFGKFYVFSSAFSLGAGHPFQGPLVALAVIGVINSAIGAAYYLRIVSTAYIGDQREAAVPAGGLALRWGIALCCIPLLLVFLWPASLAGAAREATVSLHESIERGSSHMTSLTDVTER